jgi:hypothetical protein
MPGPKIPTDQNELDRLILQRRGIGLMHRRAGFLEGEISYYKWFAFTNKPQKCPIGKYRTLFFLNPPSMPKRNGKWTVISSSTQQELIDSEFYKNALVTVINPEHRNNRSTRYDRLRKRFGDDPNKWIEYYSSKDPTVWYQKQERKLRGPYRKKVLTNQD